MERGLDRRAVREELLGQLVTLVDTDTSNYTAPQKTAAQKRINSLADQLLGTLPQTPQTLMRFLDRNRLLNGGEGDRRIKILAELARAQQRKVTKRRAK